MKMRQKTCCFTGHRLIKRHYEYDEEHSDCIQLKIRLKGVSV